jgi:CheY-like chemotaxis protein
MMEVKKRKILLVEDETVVREALRDWLTEDGYDVDVAEDGETKGVIITAYPSKETLEKAKSLGLLDYLAKPFSAEDVEKIISRALGELEEKKIGKEHLWLTLGAVSYRLCDHNYECGSCAFAQDIQDRFGTIAVIGEDEVAKLKQLSGSQKLCRYASVHFVQKEKPA